MGKPKPTLSVIIPALNEELHIEGAVEEVRRALGDRFSDWEIILVDDGSTDQTGAIMDRLAEGEPRLSVLHNPTPRNLGGVYKQGVRVARFEYVVMVPGDNENPSSALVGPFDAVGRSDIVLPYPMNVTARSPLRNTLSTAYTRLLNALFGLDVPYFNGTVVHRTENVRRVRISTDSFAYQGEALIRLLAEGKTYCAVGIEIVPRSGRRSKALSAKNFAGVALTLSRLALARTGASLAEAMTYLSKIKSREELASILREEKRRGRSIVQCHGCFDILHPGHLRHLTWAKRQGDLLLVTLSADSVVQKGRNRPFVPEQLRAESLAALEVVDLVAVDDGEWAGPILELVKPDVYVKGKEFEDVHDGRFGRERRLVEGAGGRVLFSSGDVVYSSSHIIDQHQDQLEPVAEQVAAYCQRHGIRRSRLRELLSSIGEKRLLVVGETIVDTYVYADPLGMSAEAPVLVVRPRDRETFIGGAAIVAQHLGGLGTTSTLVSLVGEDAAGERVRAHLAERGIAAELLVDASRPTIEKTRYIAEGKKLLNVNVFSDQDLDKHTEAALLARLEEAGEKADALVVTDFGYGVVSDAVLEWTTRLRTERGLPVVGDVQCSTQIGNVRRLRGVTVVSPSEREARLSAWDRTSGVADLGAQLLIDSGNQAVIITLGARGMMLFDARGNDVEALRGRHLHEVKEEITIEYLPSLAGYPVDPMGAGDALLAALAAALAAGATITEAAYLAVGAAAVAVGNVGNVPVTATQVLGALFAHTPSSMPHPMFDKSALRLRPLAERTSDLDARDVLPLDAVSSFEDAALDDLARRILGARRRGRPVILLMGAHVIRALVQPQLLDLLERGLFTHLGMNGGAAIHDFELALTGRTTESVARYVKSGEFGLWQETGRINQLAKIAASEGIGLGEAIGREIAGGAYPRADLSLLAKAYRKGVAATIHVGIGYDIVHEHPDCDGAAIGAASYTDFLVFAHAVSQLEGGVVLNVGSSVMGPEVFLKALSMARNVAHREGREIRAFSSGVFDLQDLGAQTAKEPPRDDARYYFRPFKTLLVRTVADGGESFYIRGSHRDTLPALRWSLLKQGDL